MGMTFKTTPDVALGTRLVGGVWGHLVGDAVGVPYEFRSASEIDEVSWGEKGTHGQPPGTWSDDGALMLALLDSLTTDGVGFDVEDQGRRAVDWRRNGAYRPPDRKVFDIGNTTRAALSSIENGHACRRRWPGGHRQLRQRISYADPSSRTRRPRSRRWRPDRPSTSRLPRHARSSACADRVRPIRAAGRSPAQGRGRSRRGARGRDRRRCGRGLRRARHDRRPRPPARRGERQGRGRVWDLWSAWDAFAGARPTRRRSNARSPTATTPTRRPRSPAGSRASIGRIDGIPREWLNGMRGRGWSSRSSTRSSRPLDGRHRPVGRCASTGCRPTTAPEYGGRLGMTFSGKATRRLDWPPLARPRDRRARLRIKHRSTPSSCSSRITNSRMPGCRTSGRHGDSEGIDLVRFPIRDMDVTDDPTASRSSTACRTPRSRQRVVVACRGGLGRTGTTVACLLRDAGFDADSAIRLTRKTRHDTIERGSQVDFVKAWGAGVPA